MDVILLQDVEKVGDKHTIVSVKNGFGRNYLIPKGMAIIANETNRSRLEELKQKAVTAPPHNLYRTNGERQRRDEGRRDTSDGRRFR